MNSYVIGGLCGYGLLSFFADRLYFYPVKLGTYEIIDSHEKWIGDTHGLYYRYDTKKRSKYLIMLCHGNAGHVFMRQNLCDTLRNEFQCDVYAYDYPGFGKTAGRPTEQSISQCSSCLISYWKKKYKHLILYGESIGGAVVSQLAATHPVDFIILQSSPSSIADMTAHMCGIDLSYLGLCTEFDTCKYIRSVKCPVIVLHSKDDEIVPFEHSKKILNAGKNTVFVEIDGKHNSPIIEWNKVKRAVAGGGT